MNIEQNILEVNDMIQKLNKPYSENEQNVLSFLEILKEKELSGMLFYSALSIDNFKNISREFVDELTESFRDRRELMEASYYHENDKRKIRKELYKIIHSVDINFTSLNLFASGPYKGKHVVSQANRIRYMMSGKSLDSAVFPTKKEEKRLIAPIKNYAYYLACIYFGLIDDGKELPKMLKLWLKIFHTKETFLTKADFFNMTRNSFFERFTESKEVIDQSKEILCHYYQDNRDELNPFLPHNFVFDRRTIKSGPDPGVVRYDNEVSFYQRRRCLLTPTETEGLMEELHRKAVRRLESLKNQSLKKGDIIQLNSLLKEFKEIEEWNNKRKKPS